MQDQGSDYRPENQGRRAGDSANNPDGVRDWQKDTWFGPVPTDMNPFEEPDSAPELKESRSENVNEHMGDFWSSATNGYQAFGTQPNRPVRDRTRRTEKRAGQNRPKKKARNGKVIFLVTVLVLAGIFCVLRFAVFSVRQIQVTGNNEIPASEIIRISGVRNGDNILFLNEKDVERRIASDYRLQFRYMLRHLPQTVVISVREREACCWLTYCGILYEMDKNRMVLRESENPSERPEHLVEVKGLNIRSNTIVGQEMMLGNETQRLIFSELFLEMKVLGCTAKIAEADISNTESILLATRDGFTVSLGDRENIHAKLRSMLLVQDELLRMGQSGGTISVINPEIPIYTP